MTSVVNVKVKFIRPKYNNLQEWCANPNNTYIGRAGVVFINGQRYPKTGSVFANPFRIGRDGTRENVVEKYRVYIVEKIKDPAIREEFEKLRGKTLGCWCAPESCHGDVLIELLDT